MSFLSISIHLVSRSILLYLSLPSYSLNTADFKYYLTFLLLKSTNLSHKINTSHIMHYDYNIHCYIELNYYIGDGIMNYLQSQSSRGYNRYHVNSSSDDSSNRSRSFASRSRSRSNRSSSRSFSYSNNSSNQSHNRSNRSFSRSFSYSNNSSNQSYGRSNCSSCCSNNSSNQSYGRSNRSSCRCCSHS